ncbi:MAG: transglutaminase-like domain-containing protein [Eubacteriales bacterium]|nr:transglutaminase-like domain-containing protein [Eubacteriales bacterium]
MKDKKKIRWLWGMLLLILCLFPLKETGRAAGGYEMLPTITETYVNPIYRSVVGAEDLNTPNPYGVMLTADVEYGTEAEAAVNFRGQMKQRTESIVVGLTTESESCKTQMSEIAELAMAHTGNPVEGDYLKWQYAGWTASASGYSKSGTSYWTITYTLTYYTTAAQESSVNSAVSSVISSCGLNDAGKSSYEKIRAIYDYICSKVSYDYTNLNNDDYKLKYTAYAALCNNTAVCQGYAVLFYRLSLECGIDARLIAGTGNGGAHG